MNPTIIIVLIVIVAATVFVVMRTRRENANTTDVSDSSEDDKLKIASWEDLRDAMDERKENLYVLDVRSLDEYLSGTIPGSVHIPYDVLSDNLPTEDRSARFVVYCLSGGRSRTAVRTLRSLGFENVVDFGGINRWGGELEYPKR